MRGTDRGSSAFVKVSSERAGYDGILYVGVICSFLGELCSQLLSVETLYPV